MKVKSFQEAFVEFLKKQSKFSKSEEEIRGNAKFHDRIKAKKISLDDLIKSRKTWLHRDEYAKLFATWLGIEEEVKNFNPHFFHRLLITRHVLDNYKIIYSTVSVEETDFGPIFPVCWGFLVANGKKNSNLIVEFMKDRIDVYGKEGIKNIGRLMREDYKVEMRKRYKNLYIELKANDRGVDAHIVKERYKGIKPFLPKKIIERINLSIFKFIEFKDILKQRNIPAKRGLLFFGKAGSGKTMSTKSIIEKALCKGYTILIASAVDTTLPVLELLYDLADVLSPSIVIIEDIDFGAIKREDRYTILLFGLLEILDGLKTYDGVVTIATTNKPEIIDQALLNRPGRFDELIKFEGIKENIDFDAVLKHFFKTHKIKEKISDDEKKLIFDKVRNRSFAYLSELIKRVLIYSLDKEGKANFKTEYLKAIPDFTELPEIKRIKGFIDEEAVEKEEPVDF